MNKKIISTSVITAVLLSLASTVSAFSLNSYSDDLTVMVYGKNVYASTEEQPCIMNDRTMVPLCPIFEAMGYTSVTYDEKKQTAEFYTLYANVGYRFVNDSNEAYVLGSDRSEGDGVQRTISLDVPATIKDGSFYVPLRAYCEMLGVDIQWDNSTRTVNIYPTNDIRISYEAAKAIAENEVSSDSDIVLSYPSDINDIENYNGKSAYRFRLYSKSMRENGGSGTMSMSIYVFLDGTIELVTDNQ